MRDPNKLGLIKPESFIAHRSEKSSPVHVDKAENGLCHLCIILPRKETLYLAHPARLFVDTKLLKIFNDHRYGSGECPI